MDRILTMILRRFAMIALRKGMKRSRPNGDAANKTPLTAEQKQQTRQARKAARLARRIGRF